VKLALRLTLLLLLLHPIGGGWLHPAFLALAVAGLALPPLLTHPGLWLGLTGLGAWRVVSDWPLADNHAYLLVYWFLAIAIAQRAADPAAVLSWNGRALIAGVFAFATLWKLISPDYLDDRFFRVALIEDRRLEHVVSSFSAAQPAELDALRSRLAEHADGPAPALPSDAVLEPERLRALARAATWGTFAGEASLALAFLAPLGVLRHVLLIGFCAVTYAVAPVHGFGWLLLAMGVAHLPAGAGGLRAGYLACFGLLILYAGLPWLR
jgi:hypothetical protein